MLTDVQAIVGLSNMLRSVGLRAAPQTCAAANIYTMQGNLKLPVSTQINPIAGWAGTSVAACVQLCVNLVLCNSTEYFPRTNVCFFYSADVSTAYPNPPGYRNPLQVGSCMAIAGAHHGTVAAPCVVNMCSNMLAWFDLVGICQAQG